MPRQSDEYELMPRDELDYLRTEVQKLKRNPLGDTQASITLLDSINKLNENIVTLNNIFESANDEMVKAFNETAMQEQLAKMIEQQEKLARGIVAVAELVKSVETRLAGVEQKASAFSMEGILEKRENTAANSALGANTLSSPPPLQMQAQTNTLSVRSNNPFEQEASTHDRILQEPLPSPKSTIPPLSQSTISDLDIPLPPPRRY